MILLSIVFPIREYSVDFYETLQSIRILEQKKIELIIVVPKNVPTELMKSSESKIPANTRIIYETIPGIYAAMNDGAREARGKFLFFIGAGDLILKDGMSKVLSVLMTSDIHILLFRTLMFNDEIFPPLAIRRISFQKGAMVCHQGVIMSLSRFKELGGFNPSYDLAADFDLLLRATYDSPGLDIEDEVIAFYQGGGYTSNKSSVIQITNSLFFNDFKFNAIIYLLRESIAGFYRRYRVLFSRFFQG